jgi:hypothetical protein
MSGDSGVEFHIWLESEGTEALISNYIFLIHSYVSAPCGCAGEESAPRGCAGDDVGQDTFRDQVD